MTCTFSAAGLTSLVSGQQPTFSYASTGHTGDYFAVQMVYTSLPGVMCYGGAPPFTPVLVNSAKGYTQSCSFVYQVLPLYTGLYCPNIPVTAIPSGDMVISYKGLSSGLLGTSPAPILFTAHFGPSPAAVIVTTTVGATTTTTGTSTAPGGFAATSTVYSPITTSTSTSTISSTNTITSTNTVTVSSCSAKSSSPSPSPSSSSSPAAASSSSPAAASSSSPAAASSSSPVATSSSSSSPAATSSSSPAAASSSSPVATSSSSPAATISSSVATSTSNTATSSSASPAPSLSCPANDGQTFSTPQGNFVIECYYDRYDSDMGTASPQPSSFAQCIQACASYSSCVDVSYVPGGPCYLKSSAGTPNSNGNVWGARLATATGPALPMSSSSGGAASATSTTSSAAPSSTVACPASDGQIINTSAGQFQIECGVDRNDHDMSGSPVYPSTYEGCLNACASTSGCVDVSYVPGGACYLKNGVGTVQSNSNIIGGRLLVNGQSASSKVSATSTATSSVATSSTTSYSTITVTSTISNTAYQCACTPTAALSSNSGSTLSCPASDGQTYTSECGATYAIECSADRYGNDLPNGNVQASSLNACLKACDNTSGCVDVSWVVGSPGTCYMKGTVGAIRQNSNIWGGRQLSSCTSTPKLQLKLHRKRVAKKDEKVKIVKRGNAIGPDFTYISTTTTATVTSTYTLSKSTTTTAAPAGTSTTTVNTTSFTTTTTTQPVATTTTATTTVTTCPAGPFRRWY